jgi:hypothetical protein
MCTLKNASPPLSAPVGGIPILAIVFPLKQKQNKNKNKNKKQKQNINISISISTLISHVVELYLKPTNLNKIITIGILHINSYQE